MKFPYLGHPLYIAGKVDEKQWFVGNVAHGLRIHQKSDLGLLQHSNHSFYIPLGLFSFGSSIVVISLVTPIITLSPPISILLFHIFSIFFNFFHQNFTLTTVTPSSIVLPPRFFRFLGLFRICPALFSGFGVWLYNQI